MDNQKEEIEIKRRLQYLDITIGVLLGLLAVLIIGILILKVLNRVDDPYGPDISESSALLQFFIFIGILTFISMVGPFYINVRYIKKKLSAKNQKFFSYYAFITVLFLINGILIAYDTFIFPSLMLPYVLLAVSLFSSFSNQKQPTIKS